MPSSSSLLRSRDFQRYVGGQALVLCGAWAMSATGSLWPLALAGSASLMLTVPLVRSIRARAAQRRDTRR